MFMGAHLLLHSTKPEDDRQFFRTVLGFKSVDAGHGWLIFQLPPAELALHPEDPGVAKAEHAATHADLYLMCEDLQATIAKLRAKKVPCGAISQERWGTRTTMQLPSGASIGLYQPAHPTALRLAKTKKKKRRP